MCAMNTNMQTKLTVTHAEHHAACKAWHAARRRTWALPARQRAIIEAIDRGTLRFSDSAPRLTRLGRGVARHLA
jgi:hypothetical protein